MKKESKKERMKAGRMKIFSSVRLTKDKMSKRTRVVLFSVTILNIPLLTYKILTIVNFQF
jgi:hypothetical protein